MKHLTPIILIVIAAALLTTAVLFYTRSVQGQTDYRQIESAAELVEFIATSSGAPLLIDLRDRADFEKGHLPNFLNIAWKDDGELFKTWVEPYRRDKPIILICYSGKRSGQAFEALKQKGFIRICEFTPGYASYAAQRGDNFTPELGSCDCPE